MNTNHFLSASFVALICYQFYCIGSTNAEPVYSQELFKASEVFTKNENVKSREQIKTTRTTHLSKPKRYELSRKGKNFIKKNEICKLKAYNDPDPKRRSVGWGHQIQPGEKLEHITQKKADELFEKDVEWVNAAINRLIAKNDKRFVYTQGFIDGLGSLIYNCGERGVTLTTFWERWQKCRYDKNAPGYINKNDLHYTIAAVKSSRISAKGHIERRYNEHLLMLD